MPGRGGVRDGDELGNADKRRIFHARSDRDDRTGLGTPEGTTGNGSRAMDVGREHHVVLEGHEGARREAGDGVGESAAHDSRWTSHWWWRPLNE